MPTWAADIEPRIRSRLAESRAVGFWTTADLQAFYNNGAASAHRLIFRVVQEQESKGYTQAYEHDYCSLFLERESGTVTPGRQDYPLPSNFWKMARVVLGLSPPCQAIPAHFNDDYQVRLGGRKGPTRGRPLYSVVPNTATSLIRFYVSPGDRTIPIHTFPYLFHYFRDLVRVNTLASPPIDVELPDPFNEAPIEWACYEAHLKGRTDGSAFRGNFEGIVQAVAGGPSPEVAK